MMGKIGVARPAVQTTVPGGKRVSKFESTSDPSAKTLRAGIRHSPARVHHDPRDDDLGIKARVNNGTPLLERATHRVSYAHLDKQYDLLPWRQGREVDRRQSAHDHGANAVVQRIDVGDVRLAIAGIEDGGEYERRKDAATGRVMRRSVSDHALLIIIGGICRTHK